MSADYIPADPSDTSTEKPWYPNDQTVVQAVNALIRQYKRSEDWETERKLLAALVVEDRAKYGMAPGKNDYMQLDSRIFR